MTAPFVHTYADVLAKLEYVARAAGVGADQTAQRQCVEEAYREIATAHSWSFLEANARIHLRAPATTGTVVFNLTGSTYERQLTLTGSTFPEAWVRDAAIRLADPDIVCDIEDYKTSTVVTLDATMCPIADVTSTTYSLFPRWYALPNDFLSMDVPMSEDSWLTSNPVSKAEIERLTRRDSTAGDIRKYAVAQVPDLYGTMGLFIYPPSDTAETLDIPILRRPRPIIYTGIDGTVDCKGTVTLTAGTATVEGASTAFDSAMAGSLLRVYSGSTRPTGTPGPYRYTEVYSIKSVESTTSLTLSSNATTSRAAVGYSITDPIDLDVAVYDAFVGCAKLKLAETLGSKNVLEIRRQYDGLLSKAKQADFRDHHPVVAMSGGRRRSRMADSTSREAVAGLD
jgi:hypothetical protein